MTTATVEVHQPTLWELATPCASTFTCGNIADAGYKSCADCRARVAAKMRQSRARRRDKLGRKCRGCPNAALEGHAKCAECLAERERRESTRKLARRARGYSSRSRPPAPAAPPRNIGPQTTDCVHMWMIETPSAEDTPHSTGTCSKCGSQREFLNYDDGAVKRSFNHMDKTRHRRPVASS